MPALPTLTVSQAQADRILIAFGGDLTTAVPAYRAWLMVQIRHKCMMDAASSQSALNQVATQAAVDLVISELPPPPPPPAPPVIP